jgi:hypothetical protein
MAYSWNKNIQQVKVINIEEGQVYLRRSQLCDKNKTFKFIWQLLKKSWVETVHVHLTTSAV